jgi:hypothetical protein
VAAAIAAGDRGARNTAKGKRKGGPTVTLQIVVVTMPERLAMEKGLCLGAGPPAAPRLSNSARSEAYIRRIDDTIAALKAFSIRSSGRPAAIGPGRAAGRTPFLGKSFRTYSPSRTEPHC